MTVEHKGLYSHLFEGVPKHWDLYCFSDAVDFQEGPGILAVDFHESGVPLLRLSSIADKKTTFDGCNFLDPEKVEKKWSHFKLAAGDILLSTSGSLGRVSEVAETQAGSICYTGIVRFRPKIKSLRYSFIKYFLQSDFFGKQANASAAGSVLKHFGPSHLKQMTFPVPSERDQEEIEKILTPIDDKIDLNRRINQTLEAMAQAIFKSWFVDFDPVKAKIAAIEQGEDPLRAAMRAISGKTDAELDQMRREHHDQLAATAALFPDAMEESELGEIPKGWEVGVFKQCCLRVESGGTPSRKEPVFWDGSIPWLTSGEVRDVVVLDTKEKITPDGLDSSSAKLWPAMTTVVAMYGATAGQVCLLAKEMTANQACCALIPVAEFKAFIFIAARLSIQKLSEKASGSAQQNLNKSLVENHQYVIPTKKIAEKFEKAISTLLQRWIKNQEEIATLGVVRDTLLQKLLSGELRVPNTECIAEEVRQ